MLLPNNTFLDNGRFQILHKIGVGGFGITYKALELGLLKRSDFDDSFILEKYNEPKTVVIKELFHKASCIRSDDNKVSFNEKSQAEEYEKLVKNQLDEGHKLRQLDHPNIVKTTRIFKENNTAYMVLDYIDGKDLEAIVNNTGPLQPDKAQKYFRQIAEALHEVHSKKKLHLDVAPNNILIRTKDDTAILIDFGISQSYDDTGNIIGTTSKLVVGRKENYSPLEQKGLDMLKSFYPTFDIYALGATYYFAVTGKVPPDASMMSAGHAHRVLASECNKNYNDYTDAIIDKATAIKYTNRFETALNFKTALLNEVQYLSKIKEIERLITNKNLQLAKIELENAKKNYLSTKTIEKLLSKLNTDSTPPNSQSSPISNDAEKLFNDLQNAFNKEEFETCRNFAMQLPMSYQDKVKPFLSKLTKQNIDAYNAVNQKIANLNDKLNQTQIIANNNNLYNQYKKEFGLIKSEFSGLQLPKNKLSIKLENLSNRLEATKIIQVETKPQNRKYITYATVALVGFGATFGIIKSTNSKSDAGSTTIVTDSATATNSIAADTTLKVNIDTIKKTKIDSPIITKPDIVPTLTKQEIEAVEAFGDSFDADLCSEYSKYYKIITNNNALKNNNRLKTFIRKYKESCLYN